MLRSCSGLTAFGLAGLCGAQNLVMNGDFENNTAAGTQFNNSNAAFTATMANATGFGTSQELDIVTALDFGILAQSGNWKVGMHQKANTPDDDAFALDLSSAVISGGTYTLQFYTVGLAGFGSPLGPVEVGLSNNSGGFGTMIFSGAAGGTASWTQFTFVFVAPTNAAFLTFRTSATRPNMYAFVDNVSLVPTPGVALPLAGLFFLGRRKR